MRNVERMQKMCNSDQLKKVVQPTSQLAAVSKRIAKRHQPDQLLAGIRAADINRPKMQHKPNTRNMDRRNKLNYSR
jgi:hypothetical protein